MDSGISEYALIGTDSQSFGQKWVTVTTVRSHFHRNYCTAWEGVIHYPSDEYLTYLMTVDEMMFTNEIDCSDLFGGNSERERIMIFEIGQ